MTNFVERERGYRARQTGNHHDERARQVAAYRARFIAYAEAKAAPSLAQQRADQLRANAEVLTRSIAASNEQRNADRLAGNDPTAYARKQLVGIEKALAEAERDLAHAIAAAADLPPEPPALEEDLAAPLDQTAIDVRIEAERQEREAERARGYALEAERQRLAQETIDAADRAQQLGRFKAMFMSRAVSEVGPEMFIAHEFAHQ